jgi:hypothetical protein
LRWDDRFDPDEDNMEFRLTYAGPLYAWRDDDRGHERNPRHIHDIRRKFHLQLKELWEKQPTLVSQAKNFPDTIETLHGDGFNWRPLVTKLNGLICRLEIVMLRPGHPGGAIGDIDNRLKTIFDALRRADSPTELGLRSQLGQAVPGPGEDPFYVLLQDDKFITHLAVTTDTLLEPVPDSPRENAVRLMINVTVKPYDVHLDNVTFT